MVHRLHAVLWIAASLALASCALLVDTDGLEGRATGGGGAGEGGTVVEGGAEGGGQVDGASPTDPCGDPALVLCEKFDTPAALSRYPSVTDPSTSIASDDVAFLSAPRSAKFTINPGNNGSPDATIELVTTASVAAFVFEGYVNMDHGEPQGVARLLKVMGSGVSLVLEQSGKVLEGTDVRAQLAPAPFGAWVRVRVEVRTEAPRRAIVTVGEATTGEILLTSTGSPDRVTVELGVSNASSPTRGWLVRWDDVTIKRL